MHTVEDLIELANTHLGTALAPQDAGAELAGLAAWDSVQLLRLVALLEQELGRPVPVAEVLQARSLRDIWAVAVGT
ncbi:MULTISPECIES: acyl carrier protein [unclassified Streptomyces]|uniref:acyl carrier protein n=1 Tax=unclassified Streptomyces TaxID=2593676 RepID=UPI002DD9E308|nr:MULTISPECIES: acyl carrier protein [unclassified Streptomyces]WSA95441.1 acyl carrier protein [Streptomyces sp. NBC_01795]WSB79857.1 acyl carrier protein [Streptomyces sp. NBC_01775]WSS11936.1 acyl carrier protein [Streptomyces sp. NBC_01186]WSS40650.1 acyl carrier protein [Streptomyces sp. NBC_01187]